MKIYHIGAHNAGNAGDIVILDCLHRMFPGVEWVNRPDHLPFDEAAVDQANKADLVLIGGGGLFLRDTHANDVSGWRWNCSVEMMDRIETPMAVFGVGYNRFRNQDDFIPAFSKNIAAIVQKCLFFGMREQDGAKLLSFLPDELAERVKYQPCPAMFCGRLYPEIERKNGGIVIFAPALDRPQMRFGNNEREIFAQIAKTLEALERRGYQIAIARHVGSDQRAASYLNYPVVNLAGKTTEEILTFYSKASLVIGMRLHSLIIPYGLGVPFFGIASHDKITRFCNDIGHPWWCVDVNENVEILNNRIRFTDFDKQTKCIEDEKGEYWQLSQENIIRILHATERMAV